MSHQNQIKGNEIVTGAVWQVGKQSKPIQDNRRLLHFGRSFGDNSGKRGTHFGRDETGVGLAIVLMLFHPNTPINSDV